MMGPQDCSSGTNFVEQTLSADRIIARLRSWHDPAARSHLGGRIGLGYYRPVRTTTTSILGAHHRRAGPRDLHGRGGTANRPGSRGAALRRGARGGGAHLVLYDWGGTDRLRAGRGGEYRRHREREAALRQPVPDRHGWHARGPRRHRLLGHSQGRPEVAAVR